MGNPPVPLELGQEEVEELVRLHLLQRDQVRAANAKKRKERLTFPVKKRNLFF